MTFLNKFSSSCNDKLQEVLSCPPDSKPTARKPIRHRTPLTPRPKQNHDKLKRTLTTLKILEAKLESIAVTRPVETAHSSLASPGPPAPRSMRPRDP